MEKICFVVNPVSGGEFHQKDLASLKTWVGKNLPKAEIRESAFPGHAMELGKWAAEEGIPIIIAVGGDGTLNEVLNGIAQFPKDKRPSLGVLTFGTGGDFARFLQERYNFSPTWTWLKHPKKIPIDIGLATLHSKGEPLLKRYFINVGDVGLGGEVIRQTGLRRKKLGFLEYLCTTLVAAWKYSAPRVKISGFALENGQALQEMELLILAVANGRYFGGGMCIAPEAEADDGKFQLIAVSNKISYYSLIGQLPRLYFKKHSNHKEVRYASGKKISVETLGGNLAIDLDGEYFQADQADFELIPGAVEILVPAGKI